MEKLALKLINDIENRAQEQLQILEDNFHAQRESTIHHFNQEAVEESNLYIEQELAELKNNVRQSETQFKWRVKKNLFIRRDELVEGLFEKLRIKLLDYSKTEDYQTKFVDIINQTIKAESLNDGILFVKESDVEGFKKAFKSLANLKVESTQLIEVGGFILQESNGKMAIEMTLDHQLKVQKEWFFAHSELQF